MEQRPTQVEISNSTVKNKRKLSTLCLEVVDQMEALKAAVQPLADKDKKESPFSKEKGEFLCLRDGL